MQISWRLFVNEFQIDRDPFFDRLARKLSHKVCPRDMEKKYRIYGKVLLKSAGYSRITGTTCPSLPRFYAILRADGWMDGSRAGKTKNRSLWPASPPAPFLFHYFRTKEEGSRFFFVPVGPESIEFRSGSVL